MIGRKILKFLFIFILILISILFCISIYTIFSGSLKFKVNDEIKSSDLTNISADNYTNILKSVHENLDDYVGKKISFTGYVYRVIDFSEDEFVLARDMLINSNSQSLIVGFLCKNKEIKNFENNTWIEISGTIEKGYYHSEIPIINVYDIKRVEKPDNTFVYPPDDTYIPTSVIF